MKIYFKGYNLYLVMVEVKLKCEMLLVLKYCKVKVI